MHPRGRRPPLPCRCSLRCSPAPWRSAPSDPLQVCGPRFTAPQDPGGGSTRTLLHAAAGGQAPRSRDRGGARDPPSGAIEERAGSQGFPHPGTHFLRPPFPSPDRRRRERSTEPECLRPPVPGRARPRMSRWPTSRFPAELPAHPERRWESGRRVWAPLSRPKGVVGALSGLKGRAGPERWMDGSG